MKDKNFIDLASIRAGLEKDDGKRFWRSLDELADTEEYQKLARQEFPTNPPLAKLETGVSRRNMLKLMAASAGDHPAPVTTYRLGVRSRWWWGDVDHLLARLRRSARDLALPLNAPSRFRAVVDFLKLWRPGDRSEVLKLDDPWPFVRDTLSWFRGR